MGAGETGGDEVGRDRCERWFVRRGLPHLIDDYSASTEFAADMTEEIREALAVRAVYHRVLVQATA